MIFVRRKHGIKKILGGMFFLVLSLAYGWQAMHIPLFLIGAEKFTARTLPFSLAVMGVICSLLFLIMPDEDDGFVARLKGMDWFSVCILFALMFVYALIFSYLGFFISTFLFLNAGFYALGERRIHLMLIISTLLIVLFWLILNYLLGIYIDPGTFLLNWME